MTYNRAREARLLRENSNTIKEIQEKLLNYEETYSKLPGISSSSSRNAFILQLIDSIRRIKYITLISKRNINKDIIKTCNANFNPLKASAYYLKNNNIDEAIWLVFLATHFGKSKKSGWGLTKAFYSGLNRDTSWTWCEITQNLNSFDVWLIDNHLELKSHGTFGNHRKYSSMKPSITGKTIHSYISWIMEYGGHQEMFNSMISKYSNNKNNLFDGLYKEMSKVFGFARMGKFDFICNLGKLGLIDVEPKSMFLKGATGPLVGSKLLFGENSTLNDINDKIEVLESVLGYPFGMQILEDAICNWQKNRDEYIFFRG